MRFTGFLEGLRTNLRKRVDAAILDDLDKSICPIKEIMRDGIRIYRS